MSRSFDLDQQDATRYRLDGQIDSPTQEISDPVTSRALLDELDDILVERALRQYEPRVVVSSWPTLCWDRHPYGIGPVEPTDIVKGASQYVETSEDLKTPSSRPRYEPSDTPTSTSARDIYISPRDLGSSSTPHDGPNTRFEPDRLLPHLSLPSEPARALQMGDMARWQERVYAPPGTEDVLHLPKPPPVTRHQRSASTTSPSTYVCPRCRKSHARKSDLDHHLRYHASGTHGCGHCTKTFHFPKDLRRHEKIHSGDRGLFCDVTGCKFQIKGFQRQDHLNRHRTTKHPELGAPNPIGRANSTRSAPGSFHA